MAPTSLLAALADSSSPAWDDTIASDVRFRSPFADYARSKDVAHLLDLVREVLVDVRPVRSLEEGPITFTLFDASVGGEDVQGLLFEQRDHDGRIADATLTIRPYPGLRAAMREMQALLETAPIPSAAEPP